MLTADVIHSELRRLARLTAMLSDQVRDLTNRLEALEGLSPEELWMDRRLTVTVANQAGETLFVLEATGTVPPSAQPG